MGTYGKLKIRNVKIKIILNYYELLNKYSFVKNKIEKTWIQKYDIKIKFTCSKGLHHWI